MRLVGWALGMLLAAQGAAAQSLVMVATIDGVINPFTASYLERALSAAKERAAACVIVELNTPGGLDRAMREMVQAMLSSPVPVVVYVAPSGARAASAGVFITLAAHVAAMAPGTNIGAAHPVALGEGQMDSVMNEKVTNDAMATIRAIAALRQRNVRWAEDAVRRSVSLTEREALDSGVIEIIARDRSDLLAQLDGRTVSTTNGERTLALRGARIEEFPMSALERFFDTITDPNIALLLLSLGFLGIVIEFYTPGSFGPGIAGAILLIIGFMATGSLPVNWAGILLLVLAAILLVVELYTPGVGAFAIGAALAFIVGALILFSPPSVPSPSLPVVSVSGWLVTAIAAMILFIGVVVARAVLRSQRSAPRSGLGRIIGARGIAKTTLSPMGTVLVNSEEWSAQNVGAEPISEGQRIEVIGIQGMILRVRAVSPLEAEHDHSE
ncbi:MAG: serine protease [Candidatus Kapaibacterium sp.]|nr:MAG: serine protease [Candidatus Kapabacteria bacterium]